MTIASTPEPPYVAVIFTTLVNDGTVAFSFDGTDLVLTGIDRAVTASPA